MNDQLPHRRRILVISHDVIQSNMAGPGIRYLELARVLAEEFSIVLAIPNQGDFQEDSIAFHPYHHGNWETLKDAFEGIDVIFTTGFSLHEFRLITELKIPMVVDIYDPFPLENLYIFKDADPNHKALVHLTDTAIVDVMCRNGDFFVCANARQRNWWLGLLQAKGRINPLTVDDDPTLRGLIDELPFGLPTRPFDSPPSVPPNNRGEAGRGPKTTWAALSPDDLLILWGGGLWNWLDPLTLIRAMPAILSQEPRAKLLFPGTRHPNPNVPFMKRTSEAFELAEELGLRDQSIFFGEWVPYEEWPYYLADTDVAVSLHFDTIETQFSAVRSRVLSYIWAHLPMVVTEGDTASELVGTYHLGEVVAPTDVEQVSEAILTVLKNGKAHYSTHFSELGSQLTWHNVAEPLLAFCRSPHFAADKAPAWLERQEKVATQHGLKSHSVKAKAAEELARQEEQILRQQEYIMAQENKINALQTLVQGYEQGRFMRLMRQMDRLKRKIWKSSVK